MFTPGRFLEDLMEATIDGSPLRWAGAGHSTAWYSQPNSHAQPNESHTMTGTRVWLALLLISPAYSKDLRVERTVIDADFPGGYQVEVADVNGDGKPDIIALGGATCAWYENPSWTKRIVTGPEQTPGIITSATADLNGDGKAEIAIGYDFEMNTPARGKLGIAVQGQGTDAPWTFQPIADVPSIHRVRWSDLDGDKKRDLVIAPIFGLNAKPPAYDQQFTFLQVARGLQADAQTFHPEKVAPVRVLHAIDIVDLFGDGRPSILTAHHEGTSLLFWGKLFKADKTPSWQTERILTVAGRTLPGAPAFPGSPPGAQAASEIHLGRAADGRRFLATVEPWHGNTVVAYNVALKEQPEFEGGQILDQIADRTVLDDTLDSGHALWVADVNGDGYDEILAGHRGKDARVSLYQFDGNRWNRTVIDREITAQDLRGGDLDGDGSPEVVAIGGASKNVVLYRFAPAKR